MRHEALPQSMTAEQLGVWIDENNIDKKFYSEETPYTEDEIIEFEHKSSVASRALDRLDIIEVDIKELLNNGCEDPVDRIIPPTKGRKVLKANRKFADMQIEKGSSENEIALYGIPFSSKGKILYFDIEGNVWDDYEIEMTAEQKEKYVGIFDDNSGTTIGDMSGGIDITVAVEHDDEDPIDTTQDVPNDDETSESVEEEDVASQDQKDSVVVAESVNLDEENQSKEESF